MNFNNTFDLLIATLSEADSGAQLYTELAQVSTDWKEQYELFRNHAISPLVSGLNQYVQDDNIKKAWKESTYLNIYTVDCKMKLDT